MTPEISPYRGGVHSPDEEIDKESKDKKQEAAEEMLNLILEFFGAEYEEGNEVPETLLEPRQILENLSNIGYEDFKNLIDNINARANRVPVNSKQQESSGSMQYTKGAEIHRVFPEKGDSEEIWENTFERIKEKLNTDEPVSEKTAESIALTLHQLIGETHLYKNGNGRTARAIYYLLSPNIEKNEDTFKSDFTDVVAKRDDMGDRTYVNKLFQKGIHEKLLLDRGLSPRIDKDSGELYCQTHCIGDSFDEKKIKFLALYDILENESIEFDKDEDSEVLARIRQIHDSNDFFDKVETDNGAVYTFLLGEVFQEPKPSNLESIEISGNKWRKILDDEEGQYSELKSLINQRAKEIRRDYVEAVLDLTMNEKLLSDEESNKFGKELKKYLQRAFDRNKHDSNEV
ncbi:MAG: hypothetical protein ABEJ02_04715 [Candidatus Paceibacteria bacterium]